jgi:rhodanese-related sulfurtransferase
MAGIAALGAVLAALEEGGTFRSHAELNALRGRLAAALRAAFPAVVFNAPFEHTLPTTLNFAVPGVAGKDLLDLFDAAGVRVSAGSACSAAKAAPSYVLDAMGLPVWRSAGAVRLSIGPLADDAFVDAACARIRRCGEALRTSPFGGGHPGVMQVGGDGRHGWIVFDAGTCIVIDPPREQAGRIAALVRDADLSVLAVTGSGTDPDGAAARAALRLALVDGQAEAGPPDWPAETGSVELDDGSHASCIAIGAAVLARVADGAGYLLGDARAGRLPRTAVRMAFGAIAGQDAIDRLAHGATVLCHGADVDGVACALPTPPCPGAPGQLHPDTLDVFLRRHEDALLVDVREAAEAQAGALILHGRAAHNVPLSRLAEHLAGWMAEARRPVVFVCRSGNRSAKAALCLHRAGHAQAWTVVGGAALAMRDEYCPCVR